ncbi:O-methyltransferase, family 2 [Candidatus Accumulibacter aalborgensis]|uniref:O-methyltransferase, family 2 n=1 Tax=Candidatus Accumulibacter aalborgensis TaxID=1860102 RepID=A0A1A8XL19_9PROT|nr:O-methyltransferase, family 2 [Candidatus Accumulibacter aalborgensis]
MRSQLMSRLWLWSERMYRVHFVDGIVLASSIKQFYRIAAGHIYFQALAAAVELDLFTILRAEGAMTLAELARRLDLAEQPCRILVQTLTANGVLKKRGDRYANTIMARIAFSSQNPRNVKATILWQKYIVYKPMARFLESLKEQRNVGLEEISGTGETLYERLEAHPALEKIFQDSMQEISVQANDLLARYVDFGKTRLLVDLGGGNGTNLLAVARRHPHLQGRVFDLPSICGKAAENFARQGMSDRLSAVPGNVFTDSFPEGADAFMFCHFLCIWSKSEDISFLKKAYDKLSPGGRVIVFDIMEQDSGDGPLAAAMGSPYFIGLATGRGMIYMKKEYEELCRQAGFSTIERVELPREHTAIIATK